MAENAKRGVHGGDGVGTDSGSRSWVGREEGTNLHKKRWEGGIAAGKKD